ncbi:MAG: SiaB family protein kinase [Cytophagales bacterium]|nr:SiaB family protein kinase [Bernardetiaceae bacterium]MDW8211597.1 SiaB family protein kinase [Cytophagales bacterium]
MSELVPNKSIYEFYRLVEEHHILLAFQGMMTTDILTMMGKNLKEQAEDHIFHRRIFSVMVELVQNINLHSADKAYSESDKKMVGKGIIVLSTSADGKIFTVASGNLIRKSEIESLRQKIDHINRLSEEQLRDYYLEQLRAPEDQDSSGLIGVARRAKNPLAYDFIHVDEEHAFFLLTVPIHQQNSDK